MTLESQVERLTEEIGQLARLTYEVKAKQMRVVRIDDRRYHDGDMLVSMNNEDRISLDRVLAFYEFSSGNLEATREIVNNYHSEQRQASMFDKRWVRIGGVLTLLGLWLGSIASVIAAIAYLKP